MKSGSSRAPAKGARKKIFISMAGNIGCGKTTAAKLISQKWGFELFDEPVIDNRFLKDYYADMKRWSFTLQLEFLYKRAEHHELIRTVPKACIQDRTLIEDPEIFAKYLHGLGNMDDRELQLYLEYFQKLNRGLAQPDRVVFLEVRDVDILMDRIGHRGRAEERGISRAFLEGLNAYYSTFPMVCTRKYGIEVKTVDASNVNLRTRAGKREFLDLVEPFVS